jgi:hypothetical protein
MISFLQPLPVGDAVRVLLAPPAGALLWRVLRKPTNDISGHADGSAFVVYEGNDPDVIDTQSLTNGTPYYYKPFYQALDLSWSTSASLSATPAAILTSEGPDPLETVRERLELGLKAAVTAGTLVQALGYVPVLTAPPTFEGTTFPIVTVHLSNSSPSARGLGEVVTVDLKDPFTGNWSEAEGWLTTVQLKIVSWVVGNADTRIALRKAIAAVLLGNMPVFNALGMSEIEFSQTDVEDLESYNAPVYQTLTDFSCFATLAVDAVTPPIVAVTLAPADESGDPLPLPRNFILQV